MSNKSEHSIPESRSSFFLIGLFLVLTGAIILLDQQLKTGWLIWCLGPIFGGIFLISGIKTNRLGFIIPGGILSGLGIGLLFIFSQMIQLPWQNRLGLALVSVGVGFVLISAISYWIRRGPQWWAMLTGTVIASIGATFFLSPLRLTDFVLYVVTGVGVALLVWGIFSRLFGLIIPGCLLIGIGPGIYAAWSGAVEPNGLARTGIMLVSFALGWGLITLFSRVVTHKFVWWPLIPGGILAMVGWGLYISGNPQNALSFIGNTGSIGLIIFGVYLMLLRRGIHR